MSVQPITTEEGHSLPPEGPHTITTHVRGWQTVTRIRDGDMEIFKIFRSLYPRFMPFNEAMKLGAACHAKLSFPSDYGILPFTGPDAFAMAQEYALSHHRHHRDKQLAERGGDEKLKPEELLFRVAEVRGVRLYCVGFPAAKTAGVIGIWQHPGTGVSTRLAEYLLPHVESDMVRVPFDATGDADVRVSRVPAPTYLPDTEAHRGLRERIVELLQRSPVSPIAAAAAAEAVTPDDVYLYGTGMAAYYRLHAALMRVRRGTAVALGAMFHSTYHLLEECVDGFRHFGECDAATGGDVLAKLEGFLQVEAREGRRVSYVFAEFPSNPLLVSVDLRGLRELADKYDFVLEIDDTIGSFSNVDVLPWADVVWTSLTKSFSGYADVMGGSLVLSPTSPRYGALKTTFAASYHNELFAGDADKLLRNSADYLARSAVLNRNAAALATLFAAEAQRPESPVTAVLYPSHSDTRANYEAAMRPATAEFTPGYGCLLSVDFETKSCASAFYDNLAFHQGPHLGAHLTLVVPFNEMVWGRDPEVARHHAAYGARAEQVRISVGLEEEEALVAVVKAALVFAEEEKRRRAGQ